MSMILLLKEYWPGADILWVTSSVYENWYCHIWSQYYKTLSAYHEKTVSTTIDGTTHKQTLLCNTYMEINTSHSFVMKNIIDKK